MADRIVKIPVGNRNAQMRSALSAGLAVAVLAAIAVTASSFTACAQNLPNPPPPTAQVMASAGASSAPNPAAAAGRTVSRSDENPRLFFGFLEFDWDPNAPGGVPGFGPLPDPAQAAKR